MKRLPWILLVLAGQSEVAGPAGWAQAPAVVGSSQSPAVRSPSATEIRLLQALRADPATAPFPFSTEPRGSKILLRGRVGARIIHDVAIRMAIDLGVPVEDGITIDTGFHPSSLRGGFGPAPGPGPTLTGGAGFGGPPSFGNYGFAPGGGSGGVGPGGAGAANSPALGFPSAGSYGGAPSLLPPPIFGRYDDPFYGFDPPAVVYPPWWGALNAQRAQANGAFQANPTGGGGGGRLGVMPGGAVGGGGVGTMANTTPSAVTDPAAPTSTTETDIGPIPDGTIDMAIDGAGVATIRGGIPSMAEKLAVGQKIGQTPGVTRVINLLTIKPALSKMVGSDNPPPPPIPVEAGAPATGPALAPIVSTPRNPTPPAPAARANTPGLDPASDTGITDRASRALADRAATIGSPVQVKVRDGVAQLSGKVGTVYEAMLAYRAVQQTPGVRSINDRLEFAVPDGSNGSNPLVEKGRPEDVEPYLEAQIRRQAGDFAHIDRVRITADSLDLRGTLARGEDRDRFDAVLRSMPILRGFQVHSDMPVASP